MPEALGILSIATVLLFASPGPAPLALAAVGAVYGFRRGIPFLLGILAGLAIAISLGAAGIAVLFDTWPASRLAMQVIGGIYIVYLAAKIATAPALDNNTTGQSSGSLFRDGLILNLLNPKAYAAFVAIYSQFLLPLSSNAKSVVATALATFCLATIIDIVWLSLGGALRPVFESPSRARPTRIVFGVLMVLAVVLTFASTSA